MIDPLSTPLLTDLYEYTMLQTYVELGMEREAVFELFVRRLPEHRNFLVAAGLEQALDFLEHLAFGEEELALLKDRFPSHVIDYLGQLRFTGDVHAMPEGTLFFGDEPILRVTAPLPQAQLVESRLMNLLNFQTLVASKAARSVLVAPDKLLVDFGLRRAHGAEAGILAARASYLAGFSGTATVLAGLYYDIPLYGTMAHSFVQAHENEARAFEHFAASHPRSTLLIDTYDTEKAARKVVDLTKQGLSVGSVRIDSGDLAGHAAKVRTILDEGGLGHVSIFASGNLDERKVKDLLDAPVDGFGIGTALVTSSDYPTLDCAYKLEEYDGQPRRKRSEGKATWPGRKQVFRNYDARGRMHGDVLSLDTDHQEGEALLVPVMKEGRPLAGKVPLSEIRDRTLKNYETLPDPMKGLAPAPYPVEISPALAALAEKADELEINRA
jgi:nicotinate phosphoribosyltransferase